MPAIHRVSLFPSHGRGWSYRAQTTRWRSDLPCPVSVAHSWSLRKSIRGEPYILHPPRLVILARSFGWASSRQCWPRGGNKGGSSRAWSSRPVTKLVCGLDISVDRLDLMRSPIEGRGRNVCLAFSLCSAMIAWWIGARGCGPIGGCSDSENGSDQYRVY